VDACVGRPDADASCTRVHVCTCRRALLLLGGDLVALLLFAAIGRSNHGEAVRACAASVCISLDLSRWEQ
jgi:hypothetical protein